MILDKNAVFQGVRKENIGTTEKVRNGVKICFTRSLYSVNKCKNAVCVMNHDEGMANQSKTLLN